MAVASFQHFPIADSKINNLTTSQFTASRQSLISLLPSLDHSQLIRFNVYYRALMVIINFSFTSDHKTLFLCSRFNVPRKRRPTQTKSVGFRSCRRVFFLKGWDKKPHTFIIGNIFFVFFFLLCCLFSPMLVLDDARELSTKKGVNWVWFALVHISHSGPIKAKFFPRRYPMKVFRHRVCALVPSREGTRANESV